ncbi:hypothetical protein Cgig2_010758 [Carnegiea gigantea]|uniref:Uncharacterized protein n=1 Tax=Carnegiea gigantea TaxID=171969 RepID=A0A9Q1KKQ8_9CARY|nr:hypothetical protein Cgig2_010758 [Carnegiea gigantea]
MYVTRPLSLYTKSPDLLSEKPPEGPSSGYLVVQDDESMIPTCFGLSKSLSIKEFPLPSNRIISFGYVDTEDEVFAIPVIDQPLSANRYYLIKAHQKHKGEAYACSKDEDKGISCGRSYIQDKKPRPLDPEDIYQQFEFSTATTCSNKKGFSAKSIASDGYLPKFIRTKSPLLIQRSFRTSKDFIQLEAHGLNSSLRGQLPDFNFPLSRESSLTVCVGTWLCPFVFVHEVKLEDPVKNSVYYSMSLEQRWQRIYTHDASHSLGNKVMVDVVVPTHVVALYGKDAVIDETKSDPKVTWFTPMGSSGEQFGVGLNHLIIERMVWEQKRVGWASRKERELRVVREEEYGGIGWWARFGCYVLVERFVVRRMDGSLVLTCDFMHTHEIKTKWE